MIDVFGGLNEAQREAVETLAGPLLILAGAGSGKTKTLTHRIASLLLNGVRPQEILAVTFTNKAAKEMRIRLGKLLNQPAESWSFMPYMGTFHGVCVKILHMEAENAGLDKNFVIYDEDDKTSLIKRAMKDLGMTDKQITPKGVASVISKAKNDFIEPEDYEYQVEYPNQKLIAKVYRRYEAEKRKAGAVDFDDLLLLTANLFKNNAEVREKWQQRFKHILIDEYQDTNKVQYQIVKLLVNKEQNICVVGDDWQSIYSWRGADFTNILNFERDFPGTKVIKLEQNYRSTKQILDAAHKIIEKNKNRTDKVMWTEKSEGAPVQVLALNDELEEAFFVASRILQRVSAGARRYDDFAVLYRTNAQSYAFERAFMQSQVPYKLVGGVKFYDRKEVRDVMAYLRLIYQPGDIVSFRRIVNVPARGVGEVSLEKFLRQVEGSLVKNLCNVEKMTDLQPRVKRALVNLGNLLFDMGELVDGGALPAVIIEDLLKRLDYKEYLNDGTPQGEDRVENLGVLISEASAYGSLEDFLNDAVLMSSNDESADKEKVTLMTLHAAKGLEFPVVFLVGMEEGVLPHSRAMDWANEDDLEEERRLAYVGMTRAQEELSLSYARSRFTFGQRNYQMPSRFIEDLAGETKEEDFTRVGLEEEYVEAPSFEVGDKVKSLQFGRGEIVDVDGLAVTIEFDSGQTKKLNVEYARLDKI